MIVLKTSIEDIDFTISLIEKKDITISISSIYIINMYNSDDNSYMLFWDENNNKAFCYILDRKYNKFLSNRMIRSTIYDKSFYIREVFWNCKTSEELESKIHSTVEAKHIVLLQKVNV